MQYIVADILPKTLAKDRDKLLSEIMRLKYNATLQNESIGR
jgi:hypothetical protein